MCLHWASGESKPRLLKDAVGHNCAHWFANLVRVSSLQGVLFSAKRHKLLSVSAAYATICKHSLVRGKDLVHHDDSGVLEASILLRSVEL